MNVSLGAGRKPIGLLLSPSETRKRQFFYGGIYLETFQSEDQS